MAESREVEKQALLQVAKLMMLAAKTAPKSAGMDDVLTLIVHDERIRAIADKMEEIGQERAIEMFMRDARNVRESDAIVLIGARGNRSFGLNCGACGYETCKEFENAERKRGLDFDGPTCLFKALDMGIALGSAAKTASLLNADNRIMYRIAAAAAKLGMLPEATILMGIPISARSKSIYFDRPK